MHKIEYKNAYSSWDEALPLGNGHFGVMGYFDKIEGLNFFINHYDVYYRKRDIYADENRPACYDIVRLPVQVNPPIEEISKHAFEAHNDSDHRGHNWYPAGLNPALKETYGRMDIGVGHVIAGNLKLSLNKEFVQLSEFNTQLNIEKACLDFEFEGHLNSKKQKLSIRSIVARDSDVFVTHIEQTHPSMVKAVTIEIPLNRLVRINTEKGSKNTDVFYFESSFLADEYDWAYKPDDFKNIPMRYVFMIRLLGTTGQIVEDTSSNKMTLKLDEASKDFTILSTVTTRFESENIRKNAIVKLGNAADNLSELRQSHQEYWDSFWSKSSIEIPDKVLETLWYLHLYSLACCDGHGAHLYEQACGLNGLWDIKAPTQWGSSFYWDVNIQQSYWPVFTANHLELGESFQKALLSYVEQAKKRAKSFFNLEGIAADFPYDFYFNIWPWCAQYLWWHYEYSGDKDFLRQKAYPLFKDILRFFYGFVRYDDQTGQVVIFPDVSPEQGPLTPNSTILIACLKFLLKFSIAANRILQESIDDLKQWEQMLSKMPAYPIEQSKDFGEIIKDSPWASATQFLAHSSLLMPVYPIGEISKRSPHSERQIALNTLDYAQKKQAIGSHNFAWLANTAARLGLGDLALNILYDKGIAWQMRANGMFAEETDRWSQSNALSVDSIYCPPLIEGGSAAVAAINEMLLASFDGILEIFPAVPKGEVFYQTKYDSNGIPRERRVGYPLSWDTCGFKKLLAEGAFEVSSVRQNGSTEFVMIKSLAGNLVRLINPFSSDKLSVISDNSVSVDYKYLDGVILFETERNKTYCITVFGKKHSEKNDANTDLINCPMIRISPTQRRVFLGKDHNTNFYRAVDSMTLDYLAGNKAISQITTYKFDFTEKGLLKDYRDALAPQFSYLDMEEELAIKLGPDFRKVDTNSAYSVYSGFGWRQIEGLKY
ncbi:MAG: hypothetical protein M0P61_18285, partial [Ignavibacteriaceae bacterium]|nr:hypothetical protein [Ignavibacteriaceae bacterium]